MSRFVKLGFGAGVTAVIAFAVVLVILARESRTPVHVDGPRLITALKAFTEERRSRGETVPLSVSLETLIEGGHLRPDAVSLPEGVSLQLRPDASESQPRSILAEARLPDGSTVAVLGDGSVQISSR